MNTSAEAPSEANPWVDVDRSLRRGMVTEALDAFVSSASKGLVPDDKALMWRLIDDCSTRDELKRSLEVYRVAAHTGLQVNPKLLLSHVGKFISHGLVDGAIELFERFELAHDKRLVSAHVYLFRALFHHGHARQALEYHQALVERGVALDRKTLDTVIRGLASAGDVSNAMVVMQLVRASQLGDAHPSACTTLIKALMGCERVDDAMQVFEGMVPGPDLIACNMTLHGLLSNRRVSEALELYESLATRGLAPDEVTNRTLLHGLISAKKFNKATEVFEGMRRAGWKGNPDTCTRLTARLVRLCRSDTAAMDNVIAELLRSNNLHMAADICDALLRRGAAPAPQVAGKLIQCLVAGGRLKHALRCQRMMAQARLPLPVPALNALAHSLVSRGMIGDAFAVLEHIPDIEEEKTGEGGANDDSNVQHQTGSAPRSASYFSLVRHITRKFTRRRYLEETVEELARVAARPTSSLDSYASILLLANVLLEQRRAVLAHRILSVGLRVGLPPDDLLFARLIRGLLSSGHMHLVKSLVKSMDLAGVKLSTRIYNNVIAFMVKSGYQQGSYEILKFMERNAEHLPPNVVTFNTIISGHLAAKDVPAARELLNRMFTCGPAPDAATFSIMISGLEDNGERAQALELYETMDSHDVKISPAVAAKIISILMDEGQVARARLVIKSLESQGCAIDEHVLNAHVEGLIRHGLTDEAMRFFDGVRNSATAPTATTTYSYNVIIDRLMKRGLVDLAYQLFDDMDNDGVNRDLITYNCAIDGLLKAERWSEADRLLDEATSRGLCPNTDTWNMFLASRVQSHQLDTALEEFARMRNRDVLPDTVSFNILIRGLTRERRDVQALSLYHEMQSLGANPDSHTLAAIFPLIAGGAGDDEGFAKIFEVAAAEMPATVAEFNGMMRELFNRRQVSEALQVYRGMVSQGVKPNAQTFAELIVGQLAQEPAASGDLALGYLGAMQAAGLPSDDHFFNHVIERLMTAGDTRSALQMLEAMQESSVPMGHKTLHLVIEGLVKHGETDQAALVLAAMEERGLVADAHLHHLVGRPTAREE